MEFLISQFGETSPFSIIMTLLFFALIFVWPRIMYSQILVKLDQKAMEYEQLSRKAKRLFLSRLESPSPKAKESVNRFADFFVIEPVSLDPAGIVGKLEHLMDQSEDRFDYFIDQIAPRRDSEEKANLNMGMRGVIGVNQLSKVMRHFVEIVRKSKNVQMAAIIQMQIPFIDRMMKSQFKGTEAMMRGFPVGDSIGPMVAASLTHKPSKEIERDVMMVETAIAGRKAYVMKAKGPGGRLGRLGRAAEKMIRTYKVNRIITVDAGLKLEGEKSGTVAEGVGVAIGGIGIDKYQIEEIAVKNKIPMDSIIVKVGLEEAIEPMTEEILAAEERALDLLEDIVSRYPKSSRLLIIGVGNTVGIPNTKKELADAREKIKRIARDEKAKEEQAAKKGWAIFGE